MISRVEIIFGCLVGLVLRCDFVRSNRTLTVINPTGSNGTYLKYGTMQGEEDVIPASGSHSGTVIFLHGLGSTGAKMKKAVIDAKPDFKFNHVRIIFPTAPLIPYNPENNELRHAWFDKMENISFSPERIETLKRAIEDLEEIIRNEQEAGIPLNRIVIGGFSMGGAMAMHMGYHVVPTLNAVFALSAYLHTNSSLYDELDRRTKVEMPTLFHAHGNKDKVVWHERGSDTFVKLCTYGIAGIFKTLAKMTHKIRDDEIEDLWKWIAKRLPDNSTLES